MKRLALLLLAVLVAGCGNDPVRTPRPLPADLAPATVLGGSLGLHRNTAPSTVAAFHPDDESTLVDEGGLWEVRRKDRLIGTLQIETLKDDVDLHKSSVRDHIVDPLLVGSRGDIRLSGQEVSTVEGAGGLSTLVWFGDHLLVVLQVKDTLVTGPVLAQAIIDHQQTRPSWVPLPELYAPV
jgi:hypothetical protein